MKIIAMEGLDKAGKHTAMSVLHDHLTQQGWQVATMSFPRYETPVGSLIQQWLNGTYEVDETTFELLQAADKQSGQQEIQTYEQKGIDVLLIDRYVHSEWAYGALDTDDRWLATITQYMRLPDLVLYLDVEPEVSMHRRGKYGDNDYYESDIERLRYTRNEYYCLFNERSKDIDVVIIDANQPIPFVKEGVIQKVADWVASHHEVSQEKKEVLLS